MKYKRGAIAVVVKSLFKIRPKLFVIWANRVIESFNQDGVMAINILVQESVLPCRRQWLSMRAPLRQVNNENDEELNRSVESRHISLGESRRG